ncbi:hypothetical protein ACFP1I_24090 [Dyadobacter subterraneus]|uniref:Uncharacterized protein n=1 Tax=Dyadobacter subterraneus TaxID=2773304 RepID=A0ABR9WNP7_9BACT|nr:hypothetical protein [Dyadobacter subterraneus]MBE9466471.1 hypothetical protein [Dyadobacter subterraneus]
MKDQIDFKSLWQQQEVGSVPALEEILGKAKQLNRKTKIKFFGMNFMMIATIGVIIYILMSNNFEMITTKIGAVMVIMAIVSFIAVSNSLLLILFKTIPDETNQAYLQRMIEIKKKQEFIQGILMTGYFILLSTGIALYMIEFVLKMGTAMGIFAYSITIAWILFSWFYIRPKTVKKQQAEIDLIIRKLQEISTQIEGN